MRRINIIPEQIEKKTYMYKCLKCKFTKTSVLDYSAFDGMNVVNNCAKCGGARKYKCPKCGQINTVHTIAANPNYTGTSSPPAASTTTQVPVEQPKQP
jgi:hypothetical protein